VKMGKRQIANMIILGAFLERRPVVSISNVLLALKEVLPERHHHLIPLNEEALQIGQHFASEYLQTV
jgi:2-oxoglutarate ferredoxin oxidoreductase subunit gamma